MSFEEWYETYERDGGELMLFNTIDLEAAYTAGALSVCGPDTPFTEGYAKGYSDGAQEERERCARVAEKTFKSTEAKYGMTWYLYHKDIAAAIRGQG